MKVGVRLAAFATVLVVVFGLGLGLGAAVGPLDPAGHTGAHEMDSTSTTDAPPGH